MTEPQMHQGTRLSRGLRGIHYLAIAVGCMIGIGWITMAGEWLTRAGPLGTMAGFVCGGLVMLGVAACYAELTGMMPVNGGDVVFAERVFGRNAAFFVGWFLVLMAVSVVSFEALSFVWVAEALAPWAGATPLYAVFGQNVTAQQIAFGLGVLALMYGFNRAGTGASGSVQSALTAFKLVLMLAFIGTGIALGDPARLLQSAPESASLSQGAMHSTHAAAPDAVNWLGALWVAATCAFWLGGFQVISQAAEERSPDTSLRLIGLITTGSVVIGILFYLGVVWAVSTSAPLSQLQHAALPTAAAATAVFRSRWGAVAILLAGMSGILATLNAFLLSGSRLSVALARIGFLPEAFARTDRRGTPACALGVIALIAACGIFGGKGLLLPVVNTASMGLIASYALAAAAVLRLRRTAPDAARPFRVPGGQAVLMLTALAVSTMAIFVVISPALEKSGVPIEWLVSAGWTALGALLWQARRQR